jgi:hypothetical protein
VFTKPLPNNKRRNDFTDPVPNNDGKDAYTDTALWKGLMKCAFGMGSGAMKYMPSFIKTGSNI